MKVDCPLQEKNKLRARVAKLERKVSELMQALKILFKNKEKRLKKRRKNRRRRSSGKTKKRRKLKIQQSS